VIAAERGDVARRQMVAKPGMPPLHDTSGKPSASAVASQNIGAASMSSRGRSEKVPETLTCSRRSAIRRESKRSCSSREPSW
jgi:hypothetical protein